MPDVEPVIKKLFYEDIVFMLLDMEFILLITMPVLISIIFMVLSD